MQCVAIRIETFLPSQIGSERSGESACGVARKLGIRLWIMLRDKIDYEEFCRRGQKHSGAACAGMLEVGYGANRHRPVG